MRTLAVVATVVACCGCGGSPSSPTPAPTPRASVAAPSGTFSSEANKPKGDGFTMHVACEPKAKGQKHDHFEVMPAGGGPGIQVRCKGYVDLKAAGSFVVAPMPDTDQAFV